MSKLNILWTTHDAITSKNMVLMYGENSLIHKWWDEVTIIIWGRAQLLIKEDDVVKELIKKAQDQGVEFSACLACAEDLDTKTCLQDLNIELKYWGGPLTKIIKSNEKLISV